MSSSILVRLTRSVEDQKISGPSTALEVDGLVSRFTEEATNPKTLASLAGSAFAYRYARLGVLGLASHTDGGIPAFLRIGSYGVGLTAEVSAYEGLHRSLTTLSGERSNPNLWRWNGNGGWAQGMAVSAVTFGTLKGAGALAREQNLIFQHTLQSTAMVGGQQLAFFSGLAPKPEGSLPEQLLHAEATNLQLTAGMGLFSLVAPGITSLEGSLDLSLRTRENLPLIDTSPAWAVAGVGGPEVSKAFGGKTTFVLMSKMDGEKGGDKPLLPPVSGDGKELVKAEGEIKRPTFEVLEGGGGKKSSHADELRNYFLEISGQSGSPFFRESLERLVLLQTDTSKKEPSEIVSLIDHTLVALHRTIKAELPQLSRAEWTALSAAFLSLGSHIVKEGPQVYQVSRLAQIMADLALFTQGHPDFENDPDHFLRDRLMAQTLVSLKGWLNDDSLEPLQKEALASLFVRMSIARGSLEWPKLGIEMPNVDGALSELFGYNRADLRRASLRTSRAYLDTVRSWRGSPLGGLEYSLAFYLDHWRSDHREAAAGAFEYFPEDEVISHLRRDLAVYPLNEEAREMALHRMIDLTALNTPQGLATTGLAHFLRLAMDHFRGGGNNPDPSGGSSPDQAPPIKLEKSEAKAHHFTVDPKGEGLPVTVFANDRVPISAMAIRQAQGMAALPGVVRALGMPDMHAGIAVPNGFVLATQGTIVPGAVGRDINCGMRLYRTGLNRQSTDLRELIENIAARINLGKRWGSMPLTEADVEKVLQFGVKGLGDISPETRSKNPAWDLVTKDYLEREIPRIEEEGSLPGDVKSVARSHRQIGKTQLGTVGDGNHFLEFQVVDEILNPEVASAMGIQRGDILMMIHTGSRGLGHSVGTQYMHIAKSMAKNAATPVKDIYAIPAESPEGQSYFGAMNAAANYAFANRFLLGALATQSILDLHPETNVDLIYDVAHNIIKLENHEEGPLYVHRKGATRAFPPSRMEGTPFAAFGQPVLIPGSMGTASYLLVGNEGSEASLHSVNHGAGRVMTRSEALQRQEIKKGKRNRFEGGAETSPEAISDKEFKKAMRGIELLYNDGRTIKGEAPQVYKDIDEVMGVVFAEGLATGVARLKPIAVIKE